MTPRLLPCLAALLLLSACSSQQIFYGLRERERNLCAEGPAVEYEACLQRIDMSYDEYLDQSDG